MPFADLPESPPSEEAEGALIESVSPGVAFPLSATHAGVSTREIAATMTHRSLLVFIASFPCEEGDTHLALTTGRTTGARRG